MVRSVKKTVLKKYSKHTRKAVIYVQASFHNTLVTITDVLGQVICWSSAGASGFKSTKKSSPFAAQITTQNALRSLLDQGFQRADVMISGPGRGREAALRMILASGILLHCIRDITPIPHNGCRPPKQRRI